jgi:pilus assembly protein CpaF
VSTGFGALDPWMSGDAQEVMVTGDGTVWTESCGVIRRSGTLSAAEVTATIERITRFSGRRVDLTAPVADLQLPDGSRACIVLPPVAVDGPTLCIRRFACGVLPLGSFAGIDEVRELRSLVSGRANIVVSGATSSGKTSLLNSLARCIPVRERIVVIEDTTELRLEQPHVVRLQTRPPGAEGAGEVTAQHLVRASMRLRPDRLVVGEVRGGEVVDMLLALTSGHDGCLTTVHARSAADALDRMVTLSMRDHPQFAAETVRSLVHGAVDAVVHVRRGADGSRRVHEVLRVRRRDNDG